VAAQSFVNGTQRGYHAEDVDGWRHAGICRQLCAPATQSGTTRAEQGRKE